MNKIGINYRVTLLGSSHGNLVGVLIEGVPAGFIVDLNLIQKDLDLRSPGKSKITSSRKEGDKLIIKTGIFKNKATGAPILAYVINQDQISTYYDKIKSTPRPGHADYPAYIKFKGANDYRGGGIFSGRMTIGLVISGSIAKQILNKVGIKFLAFVNEIGGLNTSPKNYNFSNDEVYANAVRVVDLLKAEECVDLIIKTKQKGDSLGGIIECRVNGLPVGLGEPIFDNLESKISHAIFGIPATKGIEFGSGFQSSRMKGSENNDQYFRDKDGSIKTDSNNCGGILGGMSNGMPLIFRVAFKPTSSIRKPQRTIEKEGGATKIKIRGRHDPCIVPRAVIIVENTAAMVILDLLIQGGFPIGK